METSIGISQVVRKFLAPIIQKNLYDEYLLEAKFPFKQYDKEQSYRNCYGRNTARVNLGVGESWLPPFALR